MEKLNINKLSVCCVIVCETYDETHRIIALAEQAGLSKKKNIFDQDEKQFKNVVISTEHNWYENQTHRSIQMNRLGHAAIIKREMRPCTVQNRMGKDS